MATPSVELQSAATTQSTVPGSIVVDSTADTVDAGDGVTTLREAIAQANATAGTDTVVFDESLSNQTILLTHGSLEITDDVVIHGLGVDELTIQGSGSDRIFDIDDGTSTQQDVVIRDLTLTDGYSSDDGGAIYNKENLTLQTVTLADNSAADDGGAIRNDGTLTMIDSTLANNTANSTGSSLSGGGAIINTVGATLTIQNSTLYGNTAKNGGAIRNDGTLILQNSTISGNTATTFGGGIVNTSDGLLFGTKATATISNSTLTNNTGGTGGGITNFGRLTVTSSIVAGNTNDSDVLNFFPGSTTSGGHNLIGNGNGTNAFTNGVEGDLVGTSANPLDPLLGDLQDNGGPTLTHALLEGSLAIDAGSNDSGLTTDQRGDSRVLDGDNDGIFQIDIGAFEWVFVPPPNTAPDNLALTGSATVLTEGSTYRLSGSFTDPDAEAHTVSIDWGTGAAPTVLNLNPGTTSFTNTPYTYSQDGQYTITVTVDDGAATTSGSTVVTVFQMGTFRAETWTGDSRDNFLDSEGGNDAIDGQAGDDVLLGGDGDDTLNGNSGNDALSGEAGRDILQGATGNDVLDGGSGNDILVGATARSATAGMGEVDELTGGNGQDTFSLGDRTGAYYDDGNSVTTGEEDYALIMDFTKGSDRIQLYGSAQDYSVGTTTFNGTTSTAIYLETSGESELIGIVVGVTNLTASNVVFVS